MRACELHLWDRQPEVDIGPAIEQRTELDLEAQTLRNLVTGRLIDEGRERPRRLLDGTLAGADGAVVELVDWKTGGQADQAEGGLDQLAIYALALRELEQLPGFEPVVVMGRAATSARLMRRE